MGDAGVVATGTPPYQHRRRRQGIVRACGVGSPMRMGSYKGNISDVREPMALRQRPAAATPSPPRSEYSGSSSHSWSLRRSPRMSASSSIPGRSGSGLP